MSYEDLGRQVIAPHRGFNAKAREVLLDSPTKGFIGGMPTKSNSDFDLLSRKLKNCNLAGRPSGQSTSASTPKSNSSNSSELGKVEFDGIGQPPKVKHQRPHQKKFLGDIGKTRSASDVFRANGHQVVDKKLFRTYQQDNVMRMPSMDSDMESIGAYRSLTGDEAVSPQPGDQPKMQRNHYDVEERRNTVSKWLEKAGQ